MPRRGPRRVGRRPPKGIAAIGACEYSTDGAAWSSVTLPDGRSISSVPQDTDAYRAQAAALNYPDSAAMSREHDAIHAALASVFGVVSPTLRDVADGVTSDRGFEEDLVKIVALRLNDLAADRLPGGGFVSWLRSTLRPVGG